VKYDKTMQYINDPTLNATDMAAVEDINEIDLLNNLKNRFFQKQIQTNVGSTLIIMNPYEAIPNTYTEDKIEEWIKVSSYIY
jgi:myosin heavy subunit